MALPNYSATTRRELIAFDIKYGFPTALKVLGEHLGQATRAKVLARHVMLSATTDPFKDMDDDWPKDKEVLVRHQLGAALLLDDALKPYMSDEQQRVAILKDVISQTGAHFIQKILPLPKTSLWQQATEQERETFLTRAMSRFFNAEIGQLYTEDQWLGFDVHRCRFAHIVRKLDRPYLAPLFCAADSVFFERPEAPVRLVRTQTIAQGGTCCDFRFHFKDES